MYNQTVATNFAADYPDCTIIEGDVTLGNAVNFIGMEQVVEIQGVISCGGDGECNGSGGGPFENFLGLENVVSLGGLSLEEGGFSFDGLTSLEIITGSVNLDECYVSSFADLTNLTQIMGDFDCQETEFEDLIGLDNLGSVGGLFRIDETETFLSSTGISSLTSIGGDFEITDCNALQDFTSFSGLADVGGDFIIYDNTVVPNLDGFENLTSIGGSLTLRYNDMLANIEGIANIDPATITFAEITNNLLLPQCAVASVCGHLLADGENLIELNAEGCNSSDQVIEQCGANGISDNGHAQFRLLSTVAQSELLIYNPRNLEFVIWDSLGREVLRSRKSASIEVSHLSAGLFLVSIEQTEESLRFVKVQD